MRTQTQIIRCAVVGCPRFRGARKGDKVPMERQVAEGWWFICAEHWKTVSLEAKRRLQKFERDRRKAEALGRDLRGYNWRVGRASAAVIAEATEIAMGIRG